MNSSEKWWLSPGVERDKDGLPRCVSCRHFHIPYVPCPGSYSPRNPPPSVFEGMTRWAQEQAQEGARTTIAEAEAVARSTGHPVPVPAPGHPVPVPVPPPEAESAPLTVRAARAAVLAALGRLEAAIEDSGYADEAQRASALAQLDGLRASVRCIQ